MDENFNNLFQQVKDQVLDQLESTSIDVALLPSGEGFNDRKIILQAYRDAFKVKPLEINQAIQINVDNAAVIVDETNIEGN